MGKAQRFMAVEQLGNAEIHQLRQFPKTAIRHYNHVGRLQIAVDHLHPLPFHEDPLVGCFQPQANLTGQPEKALQRQSPRGQNILEGLAVQVFHHIERHLIGGKAIVIDFDNVQAFLAQSRAGFRFPFKAQAGALIHCRLGEQLDSHFHPTKEQILSQIDSPHAPLSQQMYKSITLSQEATQKGIRRSKHRESRRYGEQVCKPREGIRQERATSTISTGAVIGHAHRRQSELPLMSLPIVYHPDYSAPLPPGHRFPMPKFRLLQELLLREGVIRPQQVHHPELPPLAWIESVHYP
jgi:hypothetical protein